MHLIYQVTSQNNLIEGSLEMMGGTSLKHVITPISLATNDIDIVEI